VPAAAPRIELLWWEGCPSWPDALRELEAAVFEAGLDPGAIAVREIVGWENAEAERFPGSPTVRIDGRDVQPAGEDEPYALTCRVYHRRDGRVSPTPDPADLHEALERALAGTSA
jgi:hypothetical protein